MRKNKVLLLSFLYVTYISGMHHREIVFDVRCIALRNEDQLDHETIRESESKSSRLGLNWHHNNKKYLKIIPLYKNSDDTETDCSESNPLELQQMMKEHNRIFHYSFEDEQFRIELVNAPFPKYIPYDVLGNHGQESYDADVVVIFSRL